MLQEADGVTPATDIDGTAIAAVRTGDDGGYRFDNLAPRSYVVMFEPDILNGKIFVTQDAGDDAVDSDVNPLTGKTDAVEVFAATETTDVDAGVVVPNVAPRAQDDEAAVCATETVGIDVLANDSDVEGTVLVAHIEGTEVAVGESVTLASGATVTLEADGTLSYDSSAASYEVGGETVAAADILIGDMAMDSFDYSIVDEDGATGTATVDVKVCGAKNTLGTIEASFPDGVNSVLDIDFSGQDFFTVTLSGSSDARFDGVFDMAYCVAAEVPIVPGEVNFVSLEVLDTDTSSGIVALPENAGYINWIMNQDFTSMDNGEGGTYTEGEIQGAIWGFSDGFEFIDDVPDAFGTDANSLEIYNMALAAGAEAQNFEAGEGDIVSVLLVPEDPSAVQPLIIGIEFDALAEDCLCF